MLFIIQVSQVFNKLQMKIEEIRMNRQFQTYIDKLKPLLKAGGWCCGPIIDYFTTPDVK